MAVIQERTTSSGKKKYRALIRLKGYPPQSATFERKTDAKKWAQDTESAIRDGRHFKTAEAKKHTAAEMIDRYCSQVLSNNPKKRKNQQNHLRWWKEQIGHYVLSDISSAMISQCRDELLAGEIAGRKKRSPATVAPCC